MGVRNLRDRGITPTGQGSLRSLPDVQVEHRKTTGGTHQFGQDSTVGETTPRQIYQRVRELPTEAICEQTPAVLQLPEVWPPGPAGPRSRHAGTARDDTHRPSARTTSVMIPEFY